MTPKLQLIKGLAAILNSLDSTPRACITEPINNEYKVPLYNVQNQTEIPESKAIQYPHREDYLRNIFLL